MENLSTRNSPGGTLTAVILELVFITTLSLPAFAGEADVLDAQVSCDSESVCRFDVTIRAHDLVHGYGGKELLVRLPPAQPPAH